MPAVIDPMICNKNFEQCFPAKICPESAFSLTAGGLVKIDSSLCGECPGPCVNFCDGYAIRYDHNPETFEILEKSTLGILSTDEAVQARNDLKEKEQESEAHAVIVQITDVTAENFDDEVMQSDLPVLIDFWAPWCGPCKQMAPVFEELSGEYADRMKFVKVNTEEEMMLASQFQISSIPTLYVIHQGKLVDGSVGALSKQQLIQVVERALATIQSLQPNSGLN